MEDSEDVSSETSADEAGDANDAEIESTLE
jgi:hypothetical protein